LAADSDLREGSLGGIFGWDLWEFALEGIFKRIEEMRKEIMRKGQKEVEDRKKRG